MSFHAQLCAEIARRLAPQVRPKYLVFTTERFVLDSADEIGIVSSPRYPDVGIANVSGGGAGSSATLAAPYRVATTLPAARPQWGVEIRDAERRDLVTAIEVLSPTNKQGSGRIEYLEKRNRILLSSAHLVEIDLLRGGHRVPMAGTVPPACYYAYVGRAELRPLTDLWPIRLTAELPKLPIPLLTGDADVPLDLQLAFTTLYELFGFELALDYSRPLSPGLEAEEQRFVAERLLK